MAEKARIVKIAYWTSSLSPHQLSLAKAIAKRIGDGTIAMCIGT